MNISFNPYIFQTYWKQTLAMTKNGDSRPIKWNQFRVPVYNPEKIVGSIQDFQSIRFMRMVLSDFLNQLFVDSLSPWKLVRGEWRRYNLDFDFKRRIYTKRY